jgi:hypothetical protein
MAVDAVQLVLTDEETAASDAIEADHYPLSPRVQTRRAILNKIRPEPPREPSDDDKADQIRRHAWTAADPSPVFQHSDEILAAYGYSVQDIAALRERGVVG